MKFTDDTLVVGLITNSDESEYRDQVNELFRWSSENNLVLNINKRKERIIDFRRNPIEGTVVQSHLPPFRNLGNFVHPTFACVFRKRH